MLVNVSLKSRFYTSGPIFPGIHIVDLFLYDSSMFANVMIIEDGEKTCIIDSGNSKTIGTMKNYLYFNQISLENVVIIPTHHHFDHSGGIASLIDFLESKNSNVKIWTTEEMYPLVQNPGSYLDKAKKGFKDTVGELKQIPEKYFEIQEGDACIELGDEFKIRLLKTPGHCYDHVSPLIINSFEDRICFLGEAFGINLKSDLFPIPASSAPAFDSKLYRHSIKKILQNKPNLAIFSHFGGIQGEKNIQNTGENAIYMLESFQNTIQEIYSVSGKTHEVVQSIYEKYEDTI